MQPIFLDTNILVYAYDRHEEQKYELARKLLLKELRGEKVAISSQVINEFCNIMTTKKGTPITTADLHDVIRDVLKPLLTHLPSTEFYQRAIDLCAKNSLSFYDAQIVQAALDLDCSIIYSEDLQDGQKFGLLQVVSPFKIKDRIKP